MLTHLQLCHENANKPVIAGTAGHICTKPYYMRKHEQWLRDAGLRTAAGEQRAVERDNESRSKQEHDRITNSILIARIHDLLHLELAAV